MNGGAGDDVFVFLDEDPALAGLNFGSDTITGFDANPTDGQDKLDISGLGITAATFAASVVIAHLGTNMSVTIADSVITLNGVTGVGANTIAMDDFLLAV